MSFDRVAEMFIRIKNAEMASHKEVIVPYSKLIERILQVMEKEGYIGGYEYIDDGRGGKFKVKLIGRINNCRAIKPRFPVKKDEWPRYEERYLPAYNVGILIVTTPQGVMTNREAQERKIGGRLLGFVY